MKFLGATVFWPWLDGARLLATGHDLFVTDAATAATRFDLHDATSTLFREHLNTTFLARSETGARVALRLASVVERSQCARVEQFALTFQAPDGVPSLEGICAFDHHVLGHFDVFIVPVGAAAARPVVYEACFSRMNTCG